MNKILFISYFIFFIINPLNLIANDNLVNKKDSLMRFGVEIEGYLKSISPMGILSDNFNYTPFINDFLKKNKYVKFPPNSIGIGPDKRNTKAEGWINIPSGSRLYFPEGSELRCLSSQKTNGYMIFLPVETNDVYITGLFINGAKRNIGYETSPYGACIALYAAQNITLENIKALNSTGDGITVRNNWHKQCRYIVMNNVLIDNSTRVGLLITGIINGWFKNIVVQNTGESDSKNILKPQTAISFEPNNCYSRYENCNIMELITKNNKGPVVATANFSNMLIAQNCEKFISITIDGWNDYCDDESCYGATLDISTANIARNISKYNISKLKGKILIKNANWYKKNRQQKGYFLYTNNEQLKKGVNYELKNIKTFIWQGTAYRQVAHGIFPGKKFSIE